MDWKKPAFWLAIVLVIYLLGAAIGAAAVVIINFPKESNGEITFPAKNQNNETVFFPFGRLRSSDRDLAIDQGLAILALMAGIAGSFLHTAQSLSSYIGNRTFKASWTTWYFLRPLIGGILGITLYFALRAGVVAGASTMNPYVVVAFGLLGGWFSKTTTDKLQEVFETLFTSNQDQQRRDKLSMTKQPSVGGIVPSPVPAATNEIVVVGQNFVKGATVRINNDELQADFVTDTALQVSLTNLPQRPTPGTKASIWVRNPEGIDVLSEAFEVEFR